jgi:hypothetical protein
MTPSSSMTEPGHPWVMISGNAPSCGDLTWMTWTSTPSIPVTNCGSAFSRVLGGAVAGELLDRRQLHALRPVADQLLAGQARGGDAPPQVGDRVVGHVDPEGTDFGFAGHTPPPPG